MRRCRPQTSASPAEQSPQAAQALKQFVTAAPVGSAKLLSTVLVCRTERMFNSDDCKVILKLADPALENIILQGLEAEGGQRLLGTAPAGALERVLQDNL